MIQNIDYADIDIIIKVIYCSNDDLISQSIHGTINIWNINNKNIKIKELDQNIYIWDLLLLNDKNIFISGGENGIIFWIYI